MSALACTCKDPFRERPCPAHAHLNPTPPQSGAPATAKCPHCREALIPAPHKTTFNDWYCDKCPCTSGGYCYFRNDQLPASPSASGDTVAAPSTEPAWPYKYTGEKMFNDEQMGGHSPAAPISESETPPPQDSIEKMLDELREAAVSGNGRSRANRDVPTIAAAILDSFSRLTRERDEAWAYEEEWQRINKRLRTKVSRLGEEMDEWREREAKCCPEDVGFDEYIASLESRLSELHSDYDEACASIRVLEQNVRDARAELSELRKNTLTPEEAQAALWWAQDCRHSDGCKCAPCSKLRSLAAASPESKND